MAISDDWSDWPSLPELIPISFPGVKSGRDPFVVDIDLDRLKLRMADYFNPDLSHAEIENRYPTAMRNPREYDSRAVRDALIALGGPTKPGFVRYAFRPFDNRWLYWEPREKLVDRPRLEYRPHAFQGNVWFCAVPSLRRKASEPQTAVTSQMASLHLNEWGASMFPVWLKDDGLDLDGTGTPRRPNLSPAAHRYINSLGLDVEDLFHHVIAVLHHPAYRNENAGALSMDWPRIPLPGWPGGDTDGAADQLSASAARGRELAALLDPDTSVPGVTEGTLRPEIAAIAVPATTRNDNMSGDDFALSAGWGHFGPGQAIMPGRGRVVPRPYTPDERAALGDAARVLGDTTYDIYLNDVAYWRNVPAAVWTYKLGGYQVLKKWLSYREQKVLARPLKLDEVQHFTNTARRIARILAATG